MWKKIFGIVLFALLSFTPVLCYANSTSQDNPTPVTKVTVHFWMKGSNGDWVKAQGDWTATSNGSKKMSYYNIPARNNSPIAVGSATYTFAEYWTDNFGNVYTADDSTRLQGATFIGYFEGASGPTAELNLYAGYTVEQDYTFYGNWIDNVGNGGGAESHIVNYKTGYTHTFSTPADIPERYTFLYWSNDVYGNYAAGESFNVEAGSISEDTYVDFVATYEYTPLTAVKVIYKVDGEVVKETEPSYKEIDIVENAPVLSDLSYWTLNGEPCIMTKAIPDEPVSYLTTTIEEDLIVKTVEVEAVKVIPEPAGGDDPIVPTPNPEDPVEPITPVTPVTISTPTPVSIIVVSTPTDNESTITQPVQDVNNRTVERFLKESEKIAEDITPLANETESNAPNHWALLNLIFMLGSVLCLLIIPRKKKEEDEEEEEDKKQYRSNILGIIIALATILVFIFTENVYLPMVIIDQWTLLMGILCAGSIINKVFSHKRIKN